MKEKPTWRTCSAYPDDWNRWDEANHIACYLRRNKEGNWDMMLGKRVLTTLGQDLDESKAVAELYLAGKEDT